MMGFGSYRTAWYMCHRVRAGLANEDFRKLMGIVEVDETFVGGLAKNRHKDKRGGAAELAASAPAKFLSLVLSSARERSSRASSTACAATFSGLSCAARYREGQPALHRSVGRLSRADKEFPHGVVDHSKGQYVVGAIHTNTIEGFWSIFKRGVVGTFHKVSAKYLPLYVAEFQFRYNNRENEDIFGEAIAAIATFAPPIPQASRAYQKHPPPWQG
jgi:hypothetical protein